MLSLRLGRWPRGMQSKEQRWHCLPEERAEFPEESKSALQGSFPVPGVRSSHTHLWCGSSPSPLLTYTAWCCSSLQDAQGLGQTSCTLSRFLPTTQSQILYPPSHSQVPGLRDKKTLHINLLDVDNHTVLIRCYGGLSQKYEFSGFCIRIGDVLR